MKNLNKKIVYKTLVVIGIVVVALLIFQAGFFVGYKKAGFSHIPNSHGVSGKVVKIDTVSMVVEGSDNAELG